MVGNGSSKSRVHLATAGWTLLTGYLLLAPSGGGDVAKWVEWVEAHGGDKVVHCVLFFVQAGLAGRSLSLSGLSRKPGETGTALAALFGCALEAFQLGIPGRMATWGDLAANISGSLLFLLIYRFASRQRNRTRAA